MEWGFKMYAQAVGQIALACIMMLCGIWLISDGVKALTTIQPKKPGIEVTVMQLADEHGEPLHWQANSTGGNRDGETGWIKITDRRPEEGVLVYVVDETWPDEKDVKNALSCGPWSEKMLRYRTGEDGQGYWDGDEDNSTYALRSDQEWRPSETAQEVEG